MDAHIEKILKDQLAKVGNENNWTWERAQQEIATRRLLGNYPVTFRRDGNEVVLSIFENPPSIADRSISVDFNIGNNMVLVPYLNSTQEGSSAPLAIYNLEEIGSTWYVWSAAILYRKIDLQQPAYLIYGDEDCGDLTLYQY